ncbi:nicotinamide riboside transporter PnuC [Elizabethkingia occulta]|uniref:Nicotinamide riboside transporter PnuC n=1 Tax=Elizabethkingia occulta TaxID=1867263 RepID=A0A1T3MC75_9FLAO|nr:nicotinamide riboside transporter PnuC [Elizabethkingia occulta]OPB96001.1 nicotinamide mononucleotide transporter [Elizabethkingia occulta]OPC61900.1 nicotinamide mononucleotide transporter [Elizabethkingia occulta]
MDIFNYLIDPYLSYSWQQILLESIAAIFGLLSVYFSAKKNIWVYPTGIISTTIYVYILYHFGLWGDMLINFYYTSMSIYGWIQWANSSEDHIHVEVSRATEREWEICTILFALSMALVTLVYYYKPYINNGFSMIGIILDLSHLDWANYMDILTTSIFLAGMWLMAEKKVESWWFWIIGDLICIPMMIYKELGITAIQYIIFTIISIHGYMDWSKSIKEKEKNKSNQLY